MPDQPALTSTSQTSSFRYPTPSSQPQEPELSPEAFDLVQTIFQATRNGDEDILRQTLDAGLPVNLMNEKGTSSSPGRIFQILHVGTDKV